MATLIEQLKIRMEQLGNADGQITLDFETVDGILKEIEAIQQSSNKAANPLSDSYVQEVPEKCDRIVWRGKYYHLNSIIFRIAGYK